MVFMSSFSVAPKRRNGSFMFGRRDREPVGMPAFIHTHHHHIESRILQGQLTNIIYDVAAVPAGGQPLYEVGYAGDRYASDTSNLLCRTSTRVQPVIQRRPWFRSNS
jgi:hypothetical protein